jgi:hypothetical protein
VRVVRTFYSIKEATKEVTIYHPKDSGGLRDFTTTRRILILQQLERKLWKIADAVFEFLE